jgi:hypothetical protein
MVPVPEALVTEVEQFLLLNTVRPAAQELDQDGAARLLRELDYDVCDLLLRAAHAADEKEFFTVQVAAESMGCGEHEVLGRVVELNNLVSSGGGPRLTIVPMIRRKGDDGTRVWPLGMQIETARLFLAAAHEERQPHE